jgi:hypothetical protein
MRKVGLSREFYEEHHVPVVAEYDVVVIGGGVAGISAALAARRAGCRTLLIEKSVILGGLATLGMIAVYLPLCDGNGRKIMGGIAEELLWLSIKYGHDDLPDVWRKGTTGAATVAIGANKDRFSAASGAGTNRFQTSFLPAEFVIALDELLEAEGVDVLYDTWFANVVMEGERCIGMIVENKGGRRGYAGRMFVDATGDCDVMIRAGAEWAEADNHLSYWAFTTSLARMTEAVDKGDLLKGIYLEWWGGINTGAGSPQGSRKYLGSTAEEVTSFVVDGRRLVRETLEQGGPQDLAVLAIPTMPQLRTTRRIRGYYELSESDIMTHFDDSIGTIPHWLKRGPLLEIPYRSLIAPGVANIITAGRIIGSEGEAWEMTRVIPPASLTGQAAGIAAALAIRNGQAFNELDVEDVQHELEATGVMIHF